MDNDSNNVLNFVSAAKANQTGSAMFTLTDLPTLMLNATTTQSIKIAGVIYQINITTLPEGRTCQVVLDPRFDEDNYDDEGNFKEDGLLPPEIAYECQLCAHDLARECSIFFDCEHE